MVEPPIEVVDDAPSERGASKFAKAVSAKRVTILMHESAAAQLRVEISNELANRAAELSSDLNHEDCAGLLRTLSALVVR